MHLAHAVVYLSLAPRSNAVYQAILSAKADARERLAEPVPLQIRNAETGLMKELQYGKGYQYAHDADERLTNMECLPESLAGRRYYLPGEQGSEARVKQRLDAILAWRQAHKSEK